MMNLLALSLVLGSLVVAGVWSPLPEKKLEGEDVIVREDHNRIIIVETYDEDGQHNTKVSFSPPNKQHDGFIDSTKDMMIKEASSVLPNLGQGISPDGKTSGGGGGRHTAKEAKEKIAEKVHEDVAMKRHMAHKAKETVKEKTKDVKEGTKEAIGKAKETGKQTMEAGKEAIDMAKETGTTIGSHIALNVSEKIEDVRQNAAEMAKEAKETTEHATKRAKTGANKILDLVRNMVMLDSLMGIANLLGFATAYGTGMWVTFASSYVLAELLPRQQFALVQSKTYPCLFQEMFQAYNLLSSLLMVLFNALYLEPRATKAMFERMRLEKEEGRGRESSASEPKRVVEKPHATAKTATTEAPSPAVAASAEQEALRSRMAELRERLKRLNTNSSFLNVLALMALTWHLVYLG
ncbi:hypothetical protein SLEP1_g43515 [Rubroshorea leprosula]|uniref:TMEM205-like domain-containing protein n=1 Tax=Rubroshorea leprosula TaxID=152421 RepID=A0AAV5LD73_9ROSI|nr:hypothetical protein SLEP1_g43515 [Rubroshorea leprosula]